MSKFAWVTLATNDSYSLGALVVAHSLKRVHTAHQLAVLITPGVSEAMKNKLRTVFNVVQEVNLLDSKDEANLALLKRPELGITFTKLHCWRLTQFEKCVFLDADTLVLCNSDELFEREELSAAPDVGWPDCFNSGVYVFRPNVDTFSSLMQFAVTNGSFDGGDQGLLNSYFSDWAHKDISKHLPFVYNTSSVASYSYLPAFKQFGQNTKILHFIGTAKPWLQNFNSESRKVHVPGGYQHLTTFLQYWWDIFCEDVHSRLSTEMSGLAGALSQLHLGEPKSVEQEAYEEHMRRQCWEHGNIDYMGRDSFANIWARIKQTLGETPVVVPAPVAESTSPPRFRPAKSRSRSTTPKRDMRDRSPTPQPEDNVPVEKKEGYQQIITKKSQEGKTSTQTKTVYDPTVDDDAYDAVDAPVKVTSATVAESRVEPVKPLEPVVKSTPVPVTPVQKPTPPPRQELKSPSPRDSPRPQMQQQVAQESMAGKQTTVEPVKSTRRKRLASPQATPLPTTTVPTQKPSTPKPTITVAPKTATVLKAPSFARSPQPTTPTKPTLTSPKSPSSTTTNHQSLPPPPLSSRQQSTKSIDEMDMTPLTANDELAAEQQPPPIPPRRKRESKVSRIGKAQK